MMSADEPLFPEVEVELVGHDGNTFAILRRVAIAMRKAGYGDQVGEFWIEATSGDYDHLLRTCVKWVAVS